MRKTLIGFILLAVSSSAHANSSKTLTKILEPGEFEHLAFNVGVGSISIQPSTDNKIHVTVKIDNQDGILSWLSEAADAAELEVDSWNNQLQLSVSEGDYAETWVVYVPQVEAIDINIGVGEVKVSNLATDLDIDNGVGEVRVSSLAKYYAYVDLDSGVGETEINANTGNLSTNRALVSSSQKWSGNGRYSMNIDVGVGESQVDLD